MNYKNVISMASAAVILIAAVLGCGGSSATCTGEATIEGKTYRGVADSEAQARHNTCSKYCIEGNSEFDAMYRIWLTSPNSQRVPDRNNKWAAAASDESLKRFVEGCEIKCLGDMSAKRIDVNLKCDK